MKKLLALPFLLAGCSTMQDNVNRYVAQQNAMEATCMSYGFQRHSQGMLECKQILEGTGQASPAPTFASGLRAGAGVLSPGVYAADHPGYTPYTPRPAPVYYPNARDRRPVNCTGSTLYGQTNVTCY